MVTDHLSNVDRHRSLSPRIARAIDYVQQTDFRAVPDGTHPVEGDQIFALVQRYQTRPARDDQWEAHRRHIDLQVVVDGVERIGFTHISGLRPGTYDDARDFHALTGPGDFLTMPAGHFMLLWPDDAHQPSVMLEAPAPVLKIVVKIACD